MPSGVSRPDGILFLNSGFLPRAPQGDVTVLQSDHLARMGYPTFRFDLPGLGDSEGDLPENALTMVRLIQNGEHAPFAADLAKVLQSHFGLRGLLLAGHCGGAITAIFAADRLKCANISGLLLYETDFRLRLKPEHVPTRKNVLYQEVREWTLKSPLGGKVHQAYMRIKSLRDCCACFRHRHPHESAPANGGSARGDGALPPEANTQLIQAWRRVVAKGIPILLVSAVDPVAQKDQFNYPDFLLSDGAVRVTHVKVEGTNHAFVEGSGKAALPELTEKWMLDWAPVGATDGAVPMLQSHS